jgi:hypothetical protein
MDKNISVSKKLILLTAIFSLFSTNVKAEEKNDDLKISGQIRSRTEVDARDFKNSTSPLFFTHLRTSINIEKTFLDKVKVFAQIRDSRIMGESLDSLANIKNLDLHQGYVLIKDPFEIPISAQFGRFEVNYATQRFIGSVDWHYIGRSFDGVKLNYSNKDFFSWSTDVFAYSNAAQSVYIGNATPTAYKEINNKSEELYGIWNSMKFSPLAEVNLFSYFQDNKRETTPKLADYRVLTSGLTYSGNYGLISSLLEGAYQNGMAQDKTIQAYLLSGQLFLNLADFKFGVGSDILSGNNPSSTTTKNAFTQAFGTNHLFYGFMDYFINLPKNTQNLGLNDYYFTSAWKKDTFPLSANLNIHHFASNQTAKTGENTFGQEADLTLKYKFNDKIDLVWGGSVFNPSNLIKHEDFFGKDANDLSYWSYFSVTANF